MQCRYRKSFKGVKNKREPEPRNHKYITESFGRNEKIERAITTQIPPAYRRRISNSLFR